MRYNMQIKEKDISEFFHFKKEVSSNRIPGNLVIVQKSEQTSKKTKIEYGKEEG